MVDQPAKTLQDLVKHVGRYPEDAFLFVREGLSFASERVHGSETEAHRRLQRTLLEQGLDWADLVAIDLTVPALRDISPDRLLDAIVFGAGNEAVAGTWVGGDWRPTGGRAGERDRIPVS